MRKFTQEEAAAQFYIRGYVLNDVYKTARSSVLVKGIACGHKFKTRLDNIKSGQGCRKCAGLKTSERQRTPLNLLHVEIKKLGYIPLFTKFKTTRERLLVSCKDGHPPFYAILHQLRTKRKGCPYCKFKGENLIRGYVEFILKQTSRKVLVRDKKFKAFRWLELDIFFDTLKVAFEYQGHQHTEYPNRFDKSKVTYYQRIQRDKAKRKWCKENQILLIEIHEKMNIDDIPNHIRNAFQNGLHTHPQLAHYLDAFKKTKIDGFPLDSSMLKKICHEAGRRKGKCLAIVWHGVMRKYPFRCNVCGYEWETTGNKIFQGSWCPQCANRNRNKKNRKPIIQLSLAGKFIKKWDSLTSIKKNFGMSSSVPACLSGRTKKAYGFLWKYAAPIN